METNLHIELCSQEARWGEIDILLDAAERFNPENQEHRSICRSIAVLICSHFEGSIKDVSKALVKDLAEHVAFSQLPETMQRRYVCEGLLPNVDKKEKHASLLIEKLKAASFEPDENDLMHLFDHNSHINGDVLQKYGQLFGVRDLLAIIKGSAFEDVFDGDAEDSRRLLKMAKRSCSRGAAQFPYKLGFARNDNYHISLSTCEMPGSESSMYDSFLENIFKRRHGIAHGSDLGISAGLNELRRDLVKVRLFLFGYALVLGLALNDIAEKCRV